MSVSTTITDFDPKIYDPSIFDIPPECKSDVSISIFIKQTEIGHFLH